MHSNPGRRTLLAFAVAVVLPYSPLAEWLGCVPLPAGILGALVVIAYLFAVHGVKRWFFTRYQLG